VSNDIPLKKLWDKYQSYVRTNSTSDLWVERGTLGEENVWCAGAYVIRHKAVRNAIHAAVGVQSDGHLGFQFITGIYVYIHSVLKLLLAS
jgi:hypothetical protein